MISAWKRLWARRPRLNRGQKTVRNLILSILILLWFWGMADYPLPTAEMEFRRMERANLMGPGEIQGIISRGPGTSQNIVATEGDRVIFALGYPNASPWFWPRNMEGPTLVPRNFATGDSWVAAVDVPEGTVSAELSLKTGCWYTYVRRSDGYHLTYQAVEDSPDEWDGTPRRWEKDYLIPGEKLEHGGFLFRVQDKESDRSWTEEAEAVVEREVLDCVGMWSSYQRPRESIGADIEIEAVFYDEAGNELGRAALSTPEGGESNAA